MRVQCTGSTPGLLIPILIQLLPAAILIPQLVMAGIGFCAVLFYHPVYDGVARLMPPPPAVHVVYQPQPADAQESDFGPWLNRGQVFDRVNQPGYRALALLSDTGDIRYSPRNVGRPDGFVSATSENVVDPRLMDGQIHFTDARGNVFALNPNQAFLFETDRAFAYAFDRMGRLEHVPLAQFHTEEEK